MTPEYAADRGCALPIADIRARHGSFVINAMLFLKIVRIGRSPVAIQSGANLPVVHSEPPWAISNNTSIDQAKSRVVITSEHRLAVPQWLAYFRAHAFQRR